MTNHVCPSDKKKFDPPTLTVYGDLRTLTLNVGNMGNSDNGSGSMQKTSG